jgi:hypothetical protein
MAEVTRRAVWHATEVWLFSPFGTVRPCLSQDHAPRQVFLPSACFSRPLPAPPARARTSTTTTTRAAARWTPGAIRRYPPTSTTSPPETDTAGGTRYYWLTFSSRRSPSRTPQLYITVVTVDEIGSIKTYQAIYLWNTPAWDNFDIIVQ